MTGAETREAEGHRGRDAETQGGRDAVLRLGAGRGAGLRGSGVVEGGCLGVWGGGGRLG